MQDIDGQQIETMLTPLIRQYGLAVVQDLRKLWPRARFADYQRVENIAANIDRRLQRERVKAELQESEVIEVSR